MLVFYLGMPISWDLYVINYRFYSLFIVGSIVGKLGMRKIISIFVSSFFLVEAVSASSGDPYRVSEDYWKRIKASSSFELSISDGVVEKGDKNVRIRVPVEVDLGLYEYVRVVASVNVSGELRWGWWGEKTRDFMYLSDSVLLIPDKRKHIYTLPIRFGDGNNPIFDISKELIFEFSFVEDDGVADLEISNLSLLPYSQNRPRQITIGGVCMDALWSKEIIVDRGISKGARLCFYTGIYNPQLGSFGKDVRGTNWSTDGVDFVIELIRGSGEVKKIFTCRMNPRDVIEDRVWKRHEVNFTEEDVEGNTTIRFLIDNTGNSIGDFALWGNPIIVEDSTESDDVEMPIFLISCDTLRPDHLIPYGYGLPTSPNLDKFANDAVVFERAYTTQTFTPVAHMCMLSGMHPKNHGLTRNTDVRKDIETLPEILRRNGYYTAGITGFLWWFIPSRGFSRGMDYFSVPQENLPGKRRDVFEVNREAIEFMNVVRSRRIFLFLHNYDVHSVAYGDLLYDVGSDDFRIFSSEFASLKFDLPTCLEGVPIGRVFLEHAVLGDFFPKVEHIRYINALYDDCVLKVDLALGKFFGYLKEKGLYDKALIVVVSDHGESLGEHWLFGHDNVYEESMRCLMMIKFPFNKYAGVRVREKVILEDILPTILDELDISDYGERDGQSLVNLLEGNGRGREYVFSMSLRGDMKAVIKGDYKLIVDIPKGVNAVFDISKSDGEYYNLSNNEIKVEELNQIYAKVFGVERKGWWLLFKNSDKAWWDKIEIRCSVPIRAVDIYRGIIRATNERTDSCILKGELFIPNSDYPAILQVLPSEDTSELIVKIKNFGEFWVSQQLKYEKMGAYTIFSVNSRDSSVDNISVDSVMGEAFGSLKIWDRYFGVYYFSIPEFSGEEKRINNILPYTDDTLKNLGYF